MTIEEWAKDFKSYVNALDMPRDDYKGIMEYIDDALSLLKEQEPKLVKVDGDYVLCPSCGNELFTYPEQKYCDECGQAVKWNE